MRKVKAIHSDDGIVHMMKALKEVHIRYALLFWMGVDTGLRVSDMLPLRVGVVLACKEAGFKLRIMQRKSKQPVTVTLSDKMLNLIEGYARGEDLQAQDCVFYSSKYKKDTPVSRQHVWRVFRHTGVSKGMLGIGTHTMRRTYASRHFKEHRNVLTLQERLGHRYMTSTLSYLMEPDGTMID